MPESVPETFSGLVSSPAWRADVEEWVHDRVVEKGHRVTGPGAEDPTAGSRFRGDPA